MKVPRALAAAPLVLLLAFALSSCVAVSGPQGWGSPTFDGDSVYFQQSKDRLVALRIASDGTASRTWSFPDDNRQDEKDLNLGGIYGSPVVEGGRLYFSSFKEGVFALNTADGRQAWPRPFQQFDGDIVAGVAVSEGKVVFGTTEGDVFVLNAETGQLERKWDDGYKKGIWTAPVIKDGTVYIASMDGTVDARKLSDASRVWAKPFKSTGAVGGLQLLDETHLFAPSLNKHVYILNTADGSVAAEFEASDWVWSGAGFANGTVYFGDFSGRAYAVDITSGKDRWTKASLGDDRVKAGPAIVDDVVVFGDRAPAVHFLKASDGSRLGIGVPLQGVGTIRADAVAEDGAVYLVTTKGRLFKADPESQTVTEVQVAGAGQ